MYKKMISSVAVAGFLLFGAAGLSTAQSSMPMHHHKTMHKKVSITGCLMKGNEAGEYSMKANGKMYGLTSQKVKLMDHVGHEVMVKGYITPESAEGSEANEQNSGAMEAGGDIDVTVTHLKMISTTCSQ